MATDTTGRVAAGDRPGGPAGGEPAEQERAALRAAATAGGVVPAPLGGRALVLPVIGRERSRVEAWLAGVAGDGPRGEFERLILRQAATAVALELIRVLLRSLDAYLEHHGRRERTARQVFWNRPTLRYRTRRFEEPTGRSPQSARDRIEFWLALRGRELAL